MKSLTRSVRGRWSLQKCNTFAPIDTTNILLLSFHDQISFQRRLIDGREETSVFPLETCARLLLERAKQRVATLYFLPRSDSRAIGVQFAVIQLTNADSPTLALTHPGSPPSRRLSRPARAHIGSSYFHRSLSFQLTWESAPMIHSHLSRVIRATRAHTLVRTCVRVRQSPTASRSAEVRYIVPVWIIDYTTGLSVG